MLVKMFRAAFLAAALLITAMTVGYAQDATTLPDSVVQQINAAAGANADPAAYAAAIAAIVQANPTLAALIAGQATQVKPAAASQIATSVAAVAPPAAAAAVVNAIVAQVPADQKATVGATIVSNYIANAPPTAVQTIAVALTPVLNQITATAAGGKNSDQQVSANQILIDTAVKNNSSPG